jgi:BAAT / Acyl-CoA thioester hydrolase C terminal
MSRGSEAAMLTAIHAPDAVQGVVATVPGSVIAGSQPPGGPAWLLGGHPLPYAGHQGPDCENPDALIPAERACGPVLLIAAGADQVWPSADMGRALSARLRQHGDPHGHTLLGLPRCRALPGLSHPAATRAAASARPDRPPRRPGRPGRRLAQGR